VHGWGISGSYFIPAAERLAAGFPVYVPDLPGHGRSDTPPEPLNISGLAQALLACMEAMKIERTFLVGHSMGCQIAVEVALQHPWRIDRLILIGPTPDPTARSVAEQFRCFLIGSAYERLSLTQYLVKDFTRMGRRLVPEFRFMLEDPIEDKLPKVAVSSMVVRGEKDPIAPQRWIDEAARLLRTDRVAVITGWGHAVQYSAPTQLIDAIRPFLSQVLE
jgi:2-hydroxy-6-oxonona-2,4-dienedioate hydrolase